MLVVIKTHDDRHDQDVASTDPPYSVAEEALRGKLHDVL